MNTLTSAPMM